MAPNQHNSIRLQNKIFDGYSYVFHEERNDTIYVRCKSYRTKSCRGRGKIVGGMFTLMRPHCHARDLQLSIQKTFCFQLKEACLTQFKKAREIYETLSILNLEATALLPWQEINRSMKRWRNNRNLPEIHSLNDLKIILELERYNQLFSSSTGGTNIQFITPLATTGIKAATIFDGTLLRKIVDERTNLIFIHTNKLLMPNDIICKNNIVMIIPHRSHAFQGGLGIINSTNSNTYQSTIQQMISTLGPNVPCQRIYHNFQNEVYEALRLSIPHHIQLKGTLSAHCHIILRTVAFLNIDLNEDNLIVIRKLIAVSLLPAANIYTAYMFIKRNLSAEMQEYFNDLFQIYNREWINRVGVDNYSFFEDEEALSDPFDAHTAKFKVQLNNNRKVWNFLEVVYNMHNDAHKTIEELENGRERYRVPLIRYILNRPKVNRLWRLYNERNISIPDFLAVASLLLKNYINDIIHNGIIMDAEFDVSIINLNGIDDLIDEQISSSESILYETNIYNINRVRLARRNRLLQEGLFLTDDGICMACVTNEIEIAFTPCRHCVICNDCLTTMQQIAAFNHQPLRCPMCRSIPENVRVVE